MNPVEALLSALGGCKCIVARAFAKKHKINLKNVEIELEGTLDPDGFLGRNLMQRLVSSYCNEVQD